MIALFFSSLALISNLLLANPTNHPHLSVELVTESEQFEGGSPISAGIFFTLEPGWHIYWQNPGDSGEPPEVEWELPSGFTASAISWPYPKRIEVPPLVNYGYEGKVLLPMRISTPSAAPTEVQLKANISWLVCKEECIPGDTILSKTLRSSSRPTPSKWKSLFASTRKHLPQPFPPHSNIKFYMEGESFKVIANLSDSGSKINEAHFFPSSESVIQHSIAPKVSRKEATFEFEFQKNEYAPASLQGVEGVLVVKSATEENAFHVGGPVIHRSQSSMGSLWKSILFAFLGGLILNLMPCVFPILSIKILNFVEQSGQGTRSVLGHSALYAIGILVSFWVLAGTLIALRMGGAQLGWGFQLQSPLFISLLGFLMLSMALNLLGVFEIGLSGSFSNIGSSLTQSGYAGSFFTGVLATIVATPCTAPFMGTAIGFAFTQPPHISLIIFTSLGLGMAAPYVLLSVFPPLVHRLPRPGNWMVSFKQFMAFPLLATVAWLIAVFGSQVSLEGVFQLLLGLIVFSMALWLYGKHQSNAHWAKIICVVALACAGLLLGLRHKGDPPSKVATSNSIWGEFSEPKLKELLGGGKPVFINFTAAWCITCQVNERVVFRNEEVIEKFKQKGVTLLKADWTDADPVISQRLESYGRNGVPVYALYDGSQNSPKFLPQILTVNALINALESL